MFTSCDVCLKRTPPHSITSTSIHLYKWPRSEGCLGAGAHPSYQSVVARSTLDKSIVNHLSLWFLIVIFEHAIKVKCQDHNQEKKRKKRSVSIIDFHRYFMMMIFTDACIRMLVAHMSVVNPVTQTKQFYVLFVSLFQNLSESDKKEIGVEVRTL